MIFKQFYLPCLAHASYFIGDETAGTAAVIDPQRDTDQYIAFSAQHKLQIKHVFLTHLHADFMAGHLELRDRVGGTIYLGAAAKAGYTFTPLHDGDRVEFGRIRLKALETPGHTPESVSTLGEQRRLNYALQPMSKEAFLKVVTADQPEAPPYFTYDAVLNSEERPTLDEALARGMKPLTLDAVLELKASGAQILDTRDVDEFGAAHLAGSINIGLGGQDATWAGTMLDRKHPIVIIAAPGREVESAVRLGRIGFDHVAGYLRDGFLQRGGFDSVGEIAGGIAAWEAAKLPVLRAEA